MARNKPTQVELINNIDKLITELKGAIGQAGLAGESSEFAIMVEVFLYKFLNDKFQYEVKKLSPAPLDWAKYNSFDEAINSLNNQEYSLLLKRIAGKTAKINRNQTLSYLFNNQNYNKNGQSFSDLFDNTLVDISNNNVDLFSVSTTSGEKIQLFEGICKFVIDSRNRNNFAVAIINILAGDTYNFEHVFEQKYDFFSIVFEHLISDYNTNGGGKYAEYYTPNTMARIIAKIMVPEPVQNVTVYDPTAGSGTLLMALAHEIGEDKCTIYSQDITQKSIKLMRLNLILNNLTHSLNNVYQEDILLKPANLQDGNVSEFDYIISNPPFRLDFSEAVSGLKNDSNTKKIKNGKDELVQHNRFFAGIPNVRPKTPDQMAIYLVVIQHIIYSLKDGGKAGIVVPTKFLDWTDSIATKIRIFLIDNKWINAVVSMPSNVFANTGTSVSVIFIDKSKANENVYMIDASNLGNDEKIKVNNKDITRTVLQEDDVNRIIENVKMQVINDEKTLAVLKTIENIKNKNYSLVAGQYVDIKIEHHNYTVEEFHEIVYQYNEKLRKLFSNNLKFENKIVDFFEKDNTL